MSAEKYDRDWRESLELLAMNELSIAETTRLLKQLDAPEIRSHADAPAENRWRMLSLLLLEDRQLQQRFAMKPTSTPANPASFQEASTCLSATPSTIASRPTPWATRNRLVQIAAVAACCLIAFLAGRQSRDIPTALAQSSNTLPPASTSDSTPAPPLADGVIGFASWQLGGRRVVAPVYAPKPIATEPIATDDASPQSRNALIMKASNSAAPAASAPISTAERRSLHRAGWTVEPLRTLVSVQLKSGQKCEIPMQQIRYRYVGNSIY